MVMTNADRLVDRVYFEDVDPHTIEKVGGELIELFAGGDPRIPGVVSEPELDAAILSTLEDGQDQVQS